MSTSSLSDTSIADPVFDLSVQRTKKYTEEQDKKSEEQLKQEFRNCSDQISHLLSSAVEEGILTSRDKKEFMEGMTKEKFEAGGARTLQKKTEWIEEILKKHAPNFIAIAREAINTFMDDIAAAERKGWITKKSAERWYERLYERSSSTTETKDFLQKFNEKYMANWEKLHTKKKEVESLVQKLHVSEKDVPELKKLEEKGFEDLHYTERSAAVHTVLAALVVYEAESEKLEQLYKKASETLQKQVQNGVLRKDQAGEWLESLFNRKRPPEEVQDILTGKLAEYIGNWTKVRYRYDRIVRRMRNGVPQGTQQVDEKTFLAMTYPEKENYVQETEHALNLVDRGYSNNPIDKMKLEIRSLMAQKDWEGAQEIIARAWKIADGKDIYELQSMENTIRLCARNTENGEVANEDAAQVLSQMREALQEVPSSVRTLYMQGLVAGPQVFSSLCSHLYNRIWCWDNGHLNAAIENNHQRAAVDETKYIVENGHSADTLERIDLDIVDADGKAKAMRPYNGGTWAPTVFFLDANNAGSCGVLLNELRGKEPVRDYWSTLILKNISYEKQRELVSGVNHRLKSAVRKLQSMGCGFTLTGPPQSLN